MGNETLNSTSKDKRNFILFTLAIFGSYAVFGAAATLRGTLLPRIQDEFLLTEFHIGLLLALNTTGYLLACTFTTAIAAKTGIKGTHILSMLIIAISGITIFFAPTFPTLIAAFFLLNMGFGGLDISVGVIAAKTFTRKTGTMMSIAHFFYGAGAIASPIISTTIMASRFENPLTSWRYVYIIALAFAIIPIIPSLLGRLKDRGSAKKKTDYLALIKNPRVILLIVIMLFGVMTEGGIVSWFVAYLETGLGFTSDAAALFLTFYFAAFTVGRLALGPFIDKIGFINSLAITTGFACVMIVLGVILGERGAPFIVLAGLGTATIIPTLMAIMAKLFLETIESAMTTIMTVVGTILIPANVLVGGIFNQARVHFTHLHGEQGASMAFSTGFLVFGFTCLMVSLFTLVLRHKQKKEGRLV